MKKYLTILLITVPIILTSCFSGKKTEAIHNETKSQIVTIAGIVKDIEFGKDGYTAKIITDDGIPYFATISIPNLGENSAKYRVFTVGENVTVIGELWKLGNDNRITVSDIK